MSTDTVYFTFPDNTLSYDCATCGACCKGLGVGLDHAAGEPERLVTLYPALAPFMRNTGGAWTARNPRGRCWFLGDDGLCRVEVDHGRAAKPAACRLFPFNRVFRLGAFTVIDFNSVICPLRAHRAADDDAPGLSGRIAFDALLADLATVKDAALIASPLPTEAADPEGRHAIARERRLAAACFAAFEAAAPDVDPVLAAQLPRRVAPARLRADVSRAWSQLTGRPASLPSPATLANALVLTPSMRFNQLYGPRPLLPRAERVPLLPAMWLAWLHALAEAEQLARRPITLQQATGIWSDQAVVSFLIAVWGHRPTLTPGPVALTDEPDLRARLLAFADGLTHDRQSTVGARVVAHGGPSAIERVAFAQALEVLVERMTVEG